VKILFVTKFYPPVKGGIERYSHILCTGLRERGIEVEVVAAADQDQEPCVEMVDGIKVHRLAAFASIKRMPLTLGLPRLLARLARDCDLLHFNFPNPWTEMVYLAVCGSKDSVVTYHSDIYRQKVFLWLYRPWIHAFLKRTAAIIATSPNYIESSPFLSRYRDHCRSIVLPVDIKMFTESPQEEILAIKEEFGPFVLFVGRLVYYKGLEHLIDAMGLLCGIRLVVIGQGELEGVYRAQAEKLNLGDRVRFLGRIEDDQMKLFYAACKCFVLPSIYRSEAFGMVLGEAMACGAPVISTELGTGTSYINQDGKTGYVVLPGDPVALAEKINQICKDDSSRDRLGGAGRARIEQGFTKEHMMDRTIALYEEILARPVAGAGTD
jgi:glycosyltransferase involved in cell wall biosynthesis